MEFGVGIKFHGTFKVPWNSMELPFWHGKVPWNSMEFHGTSGEFHGIPWNSMELWNIDINKFHNWGSVFQGFLYDFMSLFIRQSISSWNNEIFQFQSNFLVPLILVKWRYSILNGGLFLLHILYYINGLTHDFWTRTGGWEFDRSHGAGKSSPSHWQQVEEQAPKPVGWTMCFLLMTLVPVQKLCVNIYVYICVHSLYEFCYRSYIQQECHSVLAKLHPITFYRGVRGSWSECHLVFSLVYQLCLALW